MSVKSKLPSLRARAAQKAEAAVLEAIPVDQKLLRGIVRHLNARDLKRLGIVALGGAAAVSLAGTVGQYRMIRQLMARELKKQLAPVNAKLDALQEQNEALQRQNREMKKQLEAQ